MFRQELLGCRFESHSISFSTCVLLSLSSRQQLLLVVISNRGLTIFRFIVCLLEMCINQYYFNNTNSKMSISYTRGLFSCLGDFRSDGWLCFKMSGAQVSSCIFILRSRLKGQWLSRHAVLMVVTSQTMIAHLKFLPISHLLGFHWPK